MIQIELELTIGDEAENAFILMSQDFDDADVLDHDDDGVQVHLTIQNKNELNAMNEFFDSFGFANAIAYIDWKYKDSFAEFEIDPCSDDQFAIEIDSIDLFNQIMEKAA